MSEAVETAGRGYTRPTPQRTARTALFLGFLLSLVLFLWASMIQAPRIAAFVEAIGQATQKGTFYYPNGLFGACLSLITGGMAGSVLAILLLNFQRLGRIYRPTLGKAIAVLVLGLLAPIGLFTFLPLNGLTLLRMLPDASLGWAGRPAAAFQYVIQVAYPLAICALIVPPLIYGIRSRVLRLAMLVGVWLAGYALQVMLRGLYIGPVTL